MFRFARPKNETTLAGPLCLSQLRSFQLLLWSVAVFISAIFSVPVDASGQATQWYKGNMHTHSLWSDGNDFPEMICAWYKERGYHFLTLSDHNILSQGEKWISDQLPVKRGAPQALARYQARFVDDWIETRKTDSGGLEIRLKTLEEFRGQFEQPGKFLMIQAEEITDHFGALPIHINATNLGELIRPQGGESVVETIQNNLKAVEAQRIKLNRPVIAHLNHPNFGYGVSSTQLAAATREHFFEVFNGHPSVNHRGDEKHVGIERMWDIANALRLTHFKAQPLFGVATDDSHHYFSEQGSIPGRGWVQVRAASLDPDRIVEAMEAGDFYASSGVTLKDVQWDVGSKTLHVQVAAESGVSYRIQFVGTRKKAAADLAKAYEMDEGITEFPSNVGEVFQEFQGAEATYQLQDDDLYVRAVIVASKDVERPIWKDQKQMAWTQPVGWERP
jgi:hypothetical protein